jgi:hypothetical protein
MVHTADARHVLGKARTRFAALRPALHVSYLPPCLIALTSETTYFNNIPILNSTWPRLPNGQFTEASLRTEADGRLDQAENAALSSANQIKKSYNYDDTGYFSISVLERAMEVWDLTLVRWRGEAMRPFQEKPEYVD